MSLVILIAIIITYAILGACDYDKRRQDAQWGSAYHYDVEWTSSDWRDDV